MTSEIAFLKIRLLPSQGKFRTRLELMAAVNTKETLKELSIEISVVRMELIKQNLVIISFKKHKLGSALGDPFKEENLFLKEKLGEANKKLNTYKQLFVKEHIMLEKERTLNKVYKSRVYRQIRKLKILRQKVEKCS